MRNTRVKGHTLRNEGISRFVSRQCSEELCLTWAGKFGRSEAPPDARDGHARCSCGAESEHLPSQGARKRWHAAHKAEVAKW